MPSYQPLVNEYRGDLLDLVHNGYICVVDENSNVLFHVGDPDEKVFYRSASKPVQALPVIARRLDEQYGLTERETVIFAGSHTGDTFHVAALESICRKAGLSENDMIMKPCLPAAKEERLRVESTGAPLRRFYHNCSGKHTALMLLQRALGGDVRDYWKPDSPAQREVKRVIAVMSEYPEAQTGVGIDGCGVPVFSVGMKNIAVAFKNLACPDKIQDSSLAGAVERFVPRIHRYPEMIRGTGILCTRINMDANLVAKGGANAVYGIGLKKERLGISIKLADGVERVWPLVIKGVFDKIGYQNAETNAMLAELCPPVIFNDNGTPCGHMTCAFS